MPQRVLISGASGFVGANLARRAIADGHEVHLLLRPGHDEWRVRDLAASARPAGAKGAVVTHEVDITRGDDVHAAVAAVRPQKVFHLAAFGAYPHQLGLERMMATNFWGCVHLLDASRGAGVEAFVNAGSSSEYGYTTHAASEDDRIEPNSDYAITKAAATHYCQLAARTTGMRVVTVRFYSVYGPFEAPGRLMPALIVHGLHGQLPPLVSPATARDFVYVDDAVDAMLHVAASPAVSSGAVYNVCTGVQTRLRDVVDTARRLLNIGAEPAWDSMGPRPWDSDVWMGSPARLADAGWRARTDFATGLSRTLEWFREEPARLQFYEDHILRSTSV